jgi:hypothetical protein
MAPGKHDGMGAHCEPEDTRQSRSPPHKGAEQGKTATGLGHVATQEPPTSPGTRGKAGAHPARGQYEGRQATSLRTHGGLGANPVRGRTQGSQPWVR